MPTLSRSDSLSKRLDRLINEIERSAKMAKMVSMNASVIAVRNRAASDESFAFEAVASQIMEISEDSLKRIAGLREILLQMDSLSAVINKAGRQRMISQRFMKLALLEQQSADPSDSNQDELAELRQLFDQQLADLKRHPLNDEQITRQLQRVQALWSDFLHSIDSRNLETATRLNEEVLSEMNQAVQLYEALVSHR